MNDKERTVQEAVGALKVDETRKIYDIQYIGPEDREPGFLMTEDGAQIPFTGIEDVIAYFRDQTQTAMWRAFVSKDGEEIVRDRVKHIEVVVRITHTDA